MKKNILLLTVILSAQLASAQIFSDNFDNYALGSFIGPQSTNWTTWSGSQGGAEDVATTNNQAASAPHSVYFSSTAASGGPQDVVLTFGQLYNSGIFTLSSDFYVNAGKGAYYNIQGSQTIGSIWALNVHLDAGELVIDDGQTPNLCVGTYPEATWFNLKIEANLTLHVWKAFVNNQLVGTWVNGVNAVASADFFPLQNNQFFMDNVNFDYQTYTLPALNAMVASLDMGGFIAGQSVSPVVSIINAGQNALTAFNVNLNYNGQNYTQNVTGVNVASIASYSVNIPSFNLVAGASNAVVTITNINGGNDDNANDNTLTQVVDPVVPAAGKIVVGEEATGTWCQWCPRGAVFMDKFQADYAGYWAGIAVHNGDPMVVADYDAGIGTLIGGYPSAVVDRLGDVDPSQMSSDFFTRLQTAPKGVLTNGATYEPSTRLLNISISTEMLQATNGSYKVACALTEDGVTDETQMHIVGMLIDPQGKIDNAGYTTINEAIQNGFVTTGLQEISFTNLAQMLTVAPNPASDFANITLHIPTAAPVSVRVLDAKGGILQARQFGSLQGDFEIGLNTTNFAPGLYIVELQMNGERIQKKLVIR